MNTVLDAYQFIFYNKPFKNPVTGKITINKICDTTNVNNYILADLFSDYRRSQDVEERIISVIEDVLSGTIAEGETGSQSGTAVFIRQDFTKFIFFNGGGSYLSPDLIIPTNDFRQIAKEWKMFLDS